MTAPKIPIPTNKFEVSPIIWELLASDSYDYQRVKGKKIISPSGLGRPVQLSALEQRHGQTLEWDVTDKSYTIFGTMIHAIVEKYNPFASIAEQRMLVPVPGMPDWLLSLKPDLLVPEELMSWENCRPVVTTKENGRYGHEIPLLRARPEELDAPHIVRVVDIKYTSTWSGMKPEWIDQTKAYAWGISQAHGLGLLPDWLAGLQINGASIQFIYRDWSIGKKREAAIAGRDYPECSFNLQSAWEGDFSDIARTIADKCRAIDECKDLPDSELPACSLEDRWNRDSAYAVQGEGNVRATKKYKISDYPSEEDCMAAAAVDAQARAEKGKKKFSVVLRPGADVRCESFCPVASVCHQRRRNLEKDAVTLKGTKLT